MDRAAIVGLSAIAAFGALTSLQNFSEALTMQGNHWIMLLVAVIAGYVAGRLFAQPAKLVGLP